LLYSLIVPISRLASSGGEGTASSLTRNGSILYLDNNHLRLSTKGKSHDSDGITCFAELIAGGGIFLEHRIESAAENNAIVMELDLAQLRIALQSVSNEQRQDSATLQAAPLEQHITVLKLAKRNNIPCLCLDACTTSASGAGNIQVHHAIPIRVLRATEMQFHLPPHIPLPDVQLELVGPIKTVMERLRNISPTVYLSANMTGELTVSLDSEGASIRTFFSKLQPRFEDCQKGSGECCVKVDTKKLCAALQWQQQTSLTSDVLLCLVENEMVVLHANLNPASVGFFTYYVPVHYLSNDPRDE
jgi:HUS1 checkpoint protein